ncbi:hypothetical protein [Halobacillus salinus]|uniref:hypothetical protein n=1 Tax=Halobacillus salinus TaxID=192814 RepID=UPI0009A7A1EE|nr:hypothetical protein [Halobacillus salinus]
MAFGLKREELKAWKESVKSGNISFLTHFWLDDRFPGCDTVTKVGCSDVPKLIEWGKQYGLKPEWIHRDPRFPHYDLFGNTQYRILQAENKKDQIERFNLRHE